jgi:hypothetical protein
MGSNWDVEGPEHPAASPPQSARALSGKLPSTARRTPQRRAGNLATCTRWADAEHPRWRQTGDMARYSTTLVTDAPAVPVLDRLADFATVADWDPGVSDAALIVGEPGRIGSRYLVTATFGPRRIPLEYEIIERVDPIDGKAGRVVLVAQTGSFTSHDTITVTPTPTGSLVQYDAILTLHGPGRVLDWPLHASFQLIGRRAEQGLRAELDHLAAAKDARPE